MSDDPILHIVGGSSRSRAEQARLGFELGCHCETYAHIAEFMERPPEDGIVLARDDPAEGGASKVLELLAESTSKIWTEFRDTSLLGKAAWTTTVYREI